MKSVFLSKKTLLACALICAAGLSAWGQADATQNTATYPVGRQLELQATPSSVVAGASRWLFSAAIDDYIGVTTWQDVEFEKGYFFLGGNASGSASDGGLIGGYSTNLGSNRLGIFYHGTLVTGHGGNDGANNKDVNKIAGETTWNNDLTLLFGSEAIGGIRFDLQFSPTFSSTGENGKDNIGIPKNSADNAGTTITSLSWGKALGDLKPAITLGFKWPEYNKTERHTGDPIEIWKDAALGLQAAVAYKALEADYQLTLNFGATYKAGDNKGAINGYMDNRLNVGFNLETEIGDKLTLKAKPAVGLGLNIYDPKVTFTPSSGDKIEGYPSDSTIASGISQFDGYSVSDRPTTWFQLAPSFAAGAKYAVSEKWNLYTGLSFQFLVVNLKGTSKYKENKDDPEITDTPSAWNVTSFNSVVPSLGLELHPSDNFSVEFGLNGNLSGDSYTEWKLNLGEFGGALAVNVKF